MHVYKGEKPREEKEKRKERELVNVARDIFGRQTRITYIDLCEQLQQVLDIKERTETESCGLAFPCTCIDHDRSHELPEERLLQMYHLRY